MHKAKMLHHLSLIDKTKKRLAHASAEMSEIAFKRTEAPQKILRDKIVEGMQLKLERLHIQLDHLKEIDDMKPQPLIATKPSGASLSSD